MLCSKKKIKFKNQNKFQVLVKMCMVPNPMCVCRCRPWNVYMKHKFKDLSQVYFAPATQVRRGPRGRNGGDEVELVRGT